MIVAAEATVIDISGIINAIAVPAIEILGVLIAAGVAWLGKRILDYFGLKNDDVRRAYVLSGLQNATSSAIAETKNYVSGMDSISIRDQRVAYVVEYMNTHVPDGMRKLGITHEKVRALAEAAIDRALVRPPAGTTEGATVAQPKA